MPAGREYQALMGSPLKPGKVMSKISTPGSAGRDRFERDLTAEVARLREGAGPERVEVRGLGH